jgi:hypothetical protein
MNDWRVETDRQTETASGGGRRAAEAVANSRWDWTDSEGDGGGSDGGYNVGAIGGTYKKSPPQTTQRCLRAPMSMTKLKLGSIT